MWDSLWTIINVDRCILEIWNTVACEVVSDSAGNKLSNMIWRMKLLYKRTDRAGQWSTACCHRAKREVVQECVTQCIPLYPPLFWLPQPAAGPAKCPGRCFLTCGLKKQDRAQTLLWQFIFRLYYKVEAKPAHKVNHTHKKVLHRCKIKDHPCYDSCTQSLHSAPLEALLSVNQNYKSSPPSHKL